MQPIFPFKQARRQTQHALTVVQAAEDSPALSHLTALVKDSSARLKAIEALIPVAMRPSIQAGPIDGDTWCLLLASSATSAKVRQLLPAFLAHLRTRGWDIKDIRLKVQMKPRS